MKKTQRLRYLAAAITAAAVFFFGWTLFHAVAYTPDAEVPAPELAADAPGKNVPADHYPERLIIPSLSIDAAVQDVGVKGNGNMAAPSNFTDVGWYKYGPVPGQLGSAVIAGHVDNGLALSGVFKHITEIQEGADVYVERKDGTRLHYVVSDIQSYPYKAVPLDMLFNRADKSRLNIVSCEGDWVKADKTYDHRIVVYTTLKDIQELN